MKKLSPRDQILIALGFLAAGILIDVITSFTTFFHEIGHVTATYLSGGYAYYDIKSAFNWVETFGGNLGFAAAAGIIGEILFGFFFTVLCLHRRKLWGAAFFIGAFMILCPLQVQLDTEIDSRYFSTLVFIPYYLLVIFLWCIILIMLIPLLGDLTARKKRNTFARVIK